MLPGYSLSVLQVGFRSVPSSLGQRLLGAGGLHYVSPPGAQVKGWYPLGACLLMAITGA